MCYLRLSQTSDCCMLCVITTLLCHIAAKPIAAAVLTCSIPHYTDSTIRAPTLCARCLPLWCTTPKAVCPSTLYKCPSTTCHGTRTEVCSLNCTCSSTRPQYVDRNVGGEARVWRATGCMHDWERVGRARKKEINNLDTLQFLKSLYYYILVI